MKSGKFYKPLIYFVRYNGLVLSVGEQIPGRVVIALIEKGGIVIWENQGSFRLIASPILRNLVSHYEAARSRAILYPRIKPPATLNELSWEQGIDVSLKTAESLLSVPHEDGDELSNPNTATESHGGYSSDKPQLNAG